MTLAIINEAEANDMINVKLMTCLYRKYQVDIIVACMRQTDYYKTVAESMFTSNS